MPVSLCPSLTFPGASTLQKPRLGCLPSAAVSTHHRPQRHPPRHSPPPPSPGASTRRRFVATSAATPGDSRPVSPDSVARLQGILVEAATASASSSDSDVVYVAKARAKVMGGAKARWELAWDSRSAQFRSDTATEDIAWSVGAAARSEGGEGHCCWHVDITGRSMQLELEDRECELLAHWVLTGQWMQPPAAGELEIGLLQECGEVNGQSILVRLKLRSGLVEGRLSLCQTRDKAGALLPQWLEISTAAGIERWEYEKWREWPAGPCLPARFRHMPAAGGQNTFKMSSVEGVSLSELPPTSAISFPGNDDEPHHDGQIQPSHIGMGSVFACPSKDASKSPYSRVDYTAEGSQKVVCLRGEGGHILVEGCVDGLLSGWFILDTGTSGVLLDPSVAQGLALNKVGEHFTNGIGDRVQVGLWAGSSFQVGPVTLRTPIFSVMSLDGAVRRPPDGSRILGALGYDFLRECVVKVESRRRVPGATQPGKLEVTILPPGTLIPTTQMTLAWQRLQFISKVPLVQTGLCVEDQTEEAAPWLSQQMRAETSGLDEDEEGAVADLLASRDSALFKLCLGVGGTGCILSHQAAAQLQLFQRLLGLQPQGIISGAGGQQARLKSIDSIATVRVASLELQGMRFEAVRTLVHTDGDPPDLELGPYAAGLLAGDLFRDCTLILDYPSQRFAVVPPSADHEDS